MLEVLLKRSIQRLVQQGPAPSPGGSWQQRELERQEGAVLAEALHPLAGLPRCLSLLVHFTDQLGQLLQAVQGDGVGRDDGLPQAAALALTVDGRADAVSFNSF